MRTATLMTVIVGLLLGMIIGASMRDEAIASPPKQSSVTSWDIGESVDGEDVRCDKESVIEDFVTEAKFSTLEQRVSTLEAAIVGLQQKQAVTAATPKSNGSTGGSSGAVTTSVYASPPAVVRTVTSTYAPRWTYPGTIESHMATDHGFPVSGMSRSQLLAQHDAIHDVTGPTRAKVTSTVSTSRVVRSTSNCPGGVCPSPSSSRAFRVFRR